jgi:hypothetical protein
MKEILFFLCVLIFTIGASTSTGNEQLEYMVRMTITQTYTQTVGDNRFDMVVFDQAYATPSEDNWKDDKFTTGPKMIGEYKSTGFKVDYMVEWDITGYVVKAYWKVSDFYKGEISWIKELPLQDKKSPFKISEPIKLSPNTSYNTEEGVLGIDN